MKTSEIRKPYTGASRSLVVAIDVSYAILEPGEIPKIHGVTRFPGQEHQAGNNKIPSILYYDKDGGVMAAGAEADTSTTLSMAEDEGWVKVDLFKLRLRPRTMKLNMNGMKFGPLPAGKNAVHVFGDFLGYLFRCTRDFIVDTHANGASLWRAVEANMQFVLSHPNGWEGVQQTKMRRAAIHGGLITDSHEGKARIYFVTEGEASLHACVLNGLASDVLQDPAKSSFLIADAGGGTLDISAYTIRSQNPLVIEETAPPDCIFAGSVFVSRRARILFEEKLKNSKYGTPDALDHITKRFDETTKRLFRNKKDPQFIVFGSPLDKDLSVGIRSGQLRLSGEEVAELFEPSVSAAVSAIKTQLESSRGLIKSIFLVGGYAASAWLFTQLQERLKPFNVTVSRPDSQTSKAVADGAIGFFCDHHVSARIAKFMYGVEYLREFKADDPDHVMRKDRLTELPSGPRLLPDAFDCILARGVRVKESTVFTRKYCTELTSLSLLSVFEVEIWCYRGGNDVPKWILRNHEEFSTLCLVRADLSPLSGSAEAKQGKHGKTYWNIVFSIEIHFGLTEFRARIKWNDNGTTKYGPASIIYNERGHRTDEEEPDEIPGDDNAGSTRNQTRAPSPDSFHTPAVTAPTSKRASVVGPPPSQPSIAVPPPVDASINGRASSVASSRELSSAISDSSRSRSRSKGKERLSQFDDTASISTTRSSSKLGEALSSVWGSAASPAKSTKSLAESIRSKRATPAVAPAPLPPASEVSATPPVVGSPGLSEAQGIPTVERVVAHAPPPPPPAIVEPPAPEAAPEPVAVAHPPAGTLSSKAGSRAASVAGSRPVSVAGSRPVSVAGSRPVSVAGSRPVSVAGSRPVSVVGSVAEKPQVINRPASSVISPLSFPEVNVDPATQPITATSPTSENGLFSYGTSLANGLMTSDAAAAATSSISDTLGSLGSRLGSLGGWGQKSKTATPKGSITPASKSSRAATPQPAGTPKPSVSPTPKPASRVATPQPGGTPRPPGALLPDEEETPQPPQIEEATEPPKAPTPPPPSADQPADAPKEGAQAEEAVSSDPVQEATEADSAPPPPPEQSGEAASSEEVAEAVAAEPLQAEEASATPAADAGTEAAPSESPAPADPDLSTEATPTPAEAAPTETAPVETSETAGDNAEAAQPEGAQVEVNGSTTDEVKAEEKTDDPEAKGEDSKNDDNENKTEEGKEDDDDDEGGKTPKSTHSKGGNAGAGKKKKKGKKGK
ncbi:hypothetical protein AAF712_007945 [Marasmius tenuissimus]|uniref:Uncharacterized protein n=1 Tax=Marasmius tenuissimus TaxID=585030 RepID=A0ABR2ZWE8_9AGAR